MCFFAQILIISIFLCGLQLGHFSYIQGLGTSTLKEGMQYFKDIDIHQKYFVWVNEEDDKAIKTAFSKHKVEERKKWIYNFLHNCKVGLDIIFKDSFRLI